VLPEAAVHDRQLWVNSSLHNLSKSMKPSWRCVVGLSTLVALTGLTASCGAHKEITWSSEVLSPDGTWTATASTYGMSGPGNNYLGTAVCLKRNSAQDSGYEVLGYQEDPSTWVRGRAPFALSWPDRHTLSITFKRLPNLDLQVCKYGDVNISVDTAP
jgi:hypothetical protein